MTLEDRIRAKACELGFCKAGFTTVEDLPRVSQLARTRAYPQFFQDMIEAGSHPARLMEGTRSIIVLAYDYSELRYPAKLLAHVSRTYLSRSYLPLPGTPARKRLDDFEEFLSSEGIAFEPDRNILMMRPVGLRAGVITFGRNNFAYVDGVGSFVILYGYLVDAELSPDEPSPGCACPPGCHACIDACPTGALAREFDLELEKCMLWDNAIGYRRGPSRDVPLPHREALRMNVHGCDICQEACPRNKRALDNGAVDDPVLERISGEFSLENLLHMPEGFYERCVRPIMYNYVNDPVAFQRNAAIAMGNSGDKRYIPHLRAELDHPDEAVRSHARWALEKLDG